MSLQAPLRDDLSQHESKLIGRATLRNIIWGGVSIATVLIAIAIFMFLRVPSEIASWIYVFIGVPALAIGFWKPKNGQAPEQYIKDILEHIFGQREWVYKSESPYLRMAESSLIREETKTKRPKRIQEARR